MAEVLEFVRDRRVTVALGVLLLIVVGMAAWGWWLAGWLGAVMLAAVTVAVAVARWVFSARWCR